MDAPVRGRPKIVVAPPPELRAFKREEWQEPYQLRLPDGTVHWQSNTGPQTFALFCQCDMIVFGGTRGSGKSAAGIAWLSMGDRTLPEGHPCRATYLNDPNYKALVLRESYQDLRAWIDEAKEFFEPFGGKAHDDPAVFDFPSGAKIFTNHLGNPDAFSKFKSWNIIRILVEELTLIPEKKLFMKVLGSNRSKWPHMRAQVFCTTNPDGPGSQWVRDYFVDIYANGGVKVPWGTPVRDPITKKSRIFIPAKLEDNPYLDNEQYRGNLMAQDPDTRAAWLEGRWDAFTGKYFKEFRPRGPHSHEEQLYPWARHVVDPQPIPYWYNRWASGDWGYNHKAAFYKFAQNDQDGRVHTYDELIFQGVGSFEMGVELAKWLQPDLESLPGNKMTLYLSPDAFHKRDDTNTLAEQVQAGISKYLGPYSAFIAQFNAEERQIAEHDKARAEMLYDHRREMFAGKMSIILKRANHDRIAGWSYMREMWRYIPVMPDVKPDVNLAQKIFEQQGLVAYTEYLDQFKSIKPEVLPKAVIHSNCPILVKCIESLVHHKDQKEDVQKMDGDDPADAYRYGMMAHRDQEKAVQPRAAYVGERLQQASEKHTDYNILVQVSRAAEAQWDHNNSQHLVTWTPPRMGSMRWRH